MPKIGGYTIKKNNPDQVIEPTVEPPVIGSIHAIPLSTIHLMPNNPFQIRDDPSRAELVESVSQFGVFVPVEVRLTDNGEYEMISGSRWQHACVAGMNSIPATILALDGDDAMIHAPVP